ncbi:TIGR01457 family HAD-type hydrolase [Cohnella caldifontis]|uniref:TIGR01457 family HAD-type hydrolase n=1 Tax=Cohnella caldifontis TaxID=3027471 RepID=UPI0023EB5F26|nr:TIGR01457 family HAD-type hydrolase [Cohnella sp. YIM B05605]
MNAEGLPGEPWNLLSPLPKPRGLLFDLDGTLYRGKERVPDADRLIAQLAERGVPHWFVTNNSSRTPEDVAEHLREMGIPAVREQVVTSSLAAADYAAAEFPGAAAYVIGEPGLKQALAEAGIRVLDEAADIGERADLVVQGIDRLLTYAKLAAASARIRSGAAFVLTNPDLALPSDGGLIPGAGSIGAALRAASGHEPTVIGKPSSILMDYALKRAGLAAEQVWVVGDNPLTDIAAAVRAGCPSVLTLTGVCSASDWESSCRRAEAFPNAVCAGLDELRRLLLHHGMM